MWTKSFWLCPLLCLTFAQTPAEDPAKKELERLQGTWIMQALEINGKDVSSEKLKETFLTIQKDEYRTKVKGKEPTGFRIKLDPSKEPKSIDMIQKMPDGTEKIIKGIYKIDNNVLKLCRGLAAEQERPNQFATWPDTGYFLATWKKQAK